MKILVIGSSNTDLLVRTNSIPKPGETVLGGEFFTHSGGKGANQAVTAARMGADVTFACKIGTDKYGMDSKVLYEKEGIDTSYVFSTSEVPSGVAFLVVDKNGENSIVVASGANFKLSPKDIACIKDIDKYDIILAQLEIPMETVEYVGKLTREHNIFLILNPAPAQKLSLELLESVNILTPNETEAEIISGISVTDDESAIKAAARIHQLGVKTVIITLGAKGALLYENNIATFIPSCKVKSVDTTAAGDVFNGAVAVGLSEGKTLIESVKFASCASAISVTRQGAQPSIPNRKEVDEYLSRINCITK